MNLRRGSRSAGGSDTHRDSVQGQSLSQIHSSTTLTWTSLPGGHCTTETTVLNLELHRHRYTDLDLHLHITSTPGSYTSFVRTAVVLLDPSIDVSTISIPDRLGYFLLKFASQSSSAPALPPTLLAVTTLASPTPVRRTLGLGGAGGLCPREFTRVRSVADTGAEDAT